MVHDLQGAWQVSPRLLYKNLVSPRPADDEFPVHPRFWRYATRETATHMLGGVDKTVMTVIQCRARVCIQRSSSEINVLCRCPMYVHSRLLSTLLPTSLSSSLPPLGQTQAMVADGGRGYWITGPLGLDGQMGSRCAARSQQIKGRRRRYQAGEEEEG